MDSMEERKHRVEKTFTDLDTQRAILEKCTLHWKELTDHYDSLEQSLHKKDEELTEKEKILELKTEETEALLEKREQSVEENEQKYIARVEELKKSALEAIESSKKNGVELKFICQKMDSEGLWKYLAEHRKDIQALRAELPSALECAIDPPRLVLEAIEGFYDKNNNEGTRSENGKKFYSGLADQRRACSLLLECLVPILADPNLGEEHPIVVQSFKERAKGIAADWKSRIDVDADPANAKPLEVQAFLQLVATFGIADEFDRDELRKLVSAVSWRRQIPKLCRPLGLVEITPEIVEELVSKGKEIEAVHFAYATGVSEKFPPVPLLKAYLKNSKKATLATLKSGNNSATANESNTKELNALKAVIRCIEEHNLQSLFSPESLQNRVVELEKKRAQRKKSGGPVKSLNKRPRSSGGGSGAEWTTAKARRVSNAYGSSNASDRNFYRSADIAQYPAAAAGVAAYGLPGHNNYDRSNQAMYGTSYGGGNRSPVSLSKAYAYPSEEMGVSMRGSGSYNTTANYGNYHFGSSVPSAYQSSY